MLSKDQLARYARNIAMEAIGITGQERLLNSRVMVVGTGGLGSPVCFYLAAAGIGTLGIIDNDVVDPSNLQRQILHTTADIGFAKVISAERSIKALNPEVNVRSIGARVTVENASELMAGYDVVVSAVDNFRTRYVLNDACVKEGKPLIDAGVVAFDGMAMTILPGQGPCYRCLFPNEPSFETGERQKRLGILGSVAGMLGSIQATETVKTLLGLEGTLTGRALLVDARDMAFREIIVPRDEHCETCGRTGRDAR